MNWRALPPVASLRAFAAFAQAGNVIEAGDNLGVSHAAISQQLRQLEDRLGLRLLDRSGRALRLTAEGELLARACTDGFARMIEAVEALTGALADRPLHITTTATFAAAWLMPRLGAFRSAHPGIDLTIAPSPDLVALEPGGVDMAIRFGHGDWAGLDCETLLNSPLVVVAAPSLVDGLPDTRPETLARLPWLEETGRSEGSAWLDHHGIGPERKGGWVHLPGNLVLDGARDGHGVAITVRAFAEPDLAASRLVMLDESDDKTTGYHALTRPGPLRPALRIFRRWLLAEAAKAPISPAL